MKHIQKERYTCDRCGNKIEKIPSDVIPFWKNILCRRICKPSELHTLTADRHGYISDVNLISKDVASVEIVEFYSNKRKELHLCRMCRKEFERFMKMDC